MSEELKNYSDEFIDSVVKQALATERVNRDAAVAALAQAESDKDDAEQECDALRAQLQVAKGALGEIIAECPNPKLPYGMSVVNIAQDALAQLGGDKAHSPDCDVNDQNPDGIVKPCNCQRMSAEKESQCKERDSGKNLPRPNQKIAVRSVWKS